MVRNREEILKILEKNQNVIRGYGVRRLGLFGSCARGECNEVSDLDFVVEFEKKSFDAYMDLKLLLEKLFDCQVDLVISDSIKPRLRSLILGEAIHAPGL
jgi:predicted nucleotidyltransferase